MRHWSAKRECLRLARRFEDRIPVRDEIFGTGPNRPWGPPSLLWNGYRVSFPGVKRLGCGVNHPPPFSAEVQERVELCLYVPSRPSWPVLGWTLPLPISECFDKNLLGRKCISNAFTYTSVGTDFEQLLDCKAISNKMKRVLLNNFKLLRSLQS